MNRTSMSINELAKQLNIPLATLRRYLRQHSRLLHLAKEHRNYVIGEDTIHTLVQIREAYAEGLTTTEVDKRFLPADFDPEEMMDEPSVENETASFVKLLSDLEKAIIQRFEQQDQLLQSLAETAAANQSELTRRDQEQQRLERIERVNDRLTEWRIERTLQKEAMDKWAALPEAQRLVKKGMFNKEEDREEKERFVRDYVDKYFETELRRAYGL
jgi:hypothetical protein